MPVPEIVYYVATSIDGYIATPDGGVEWLAPYEGKGEDYGYAEFYDSVDAVLLGSRTYEKALSFGAWPYSDKPSWVFSQRRMSTAPANVIVTTDSPVQVVDELKTRGLRRAWLVGGGALTASFREQGLVTEYIVSVIPAILGAGIPLFASSGEMEYLTLADSRSYPSGIVQLRYLQKK